MARPIDYSKWDNIDTDSDDDTKPPCTKQPANTKATSTTAAPKLTTAQGTSTTFSSRPPTTTTKLSSPTEGLILYCRGEPQVLESIQLAPTDPFFSSPQTHACPVPALLGIPLLIQRHMKEKPSSIPRSAALDNQFATWSMIDPTTGFAPPDWQVNVGTVTLARKDGVKFTSDDLSCLTDYIGILLDKYSDGEGLLEGNANRQDGSTTATQSNAEDEEEALVALRYEEAEKTKAKCFSFLRVWMVPYIVCLSDVLFGLASGMTIKFFPIYFAEVLKLPPTTVNIVFVLDPVTEVLFSLTAQKLSLTFGRVEVALVFKLVGVSLLAVMAYFPDAWIAQPYWLCAIYIIRSALINCVVPLNRSILMDYASVKSRGKWNSIDSVAAFGWSGSAVVGGLLVDNYGFEMSFVCTALIQFIAWCPLILLLPLVTREERIEAKRRASSIGDRAPLAFPEPIMGHQEYQQ